MAEQADSPADTVEAVVTQALDEVKGILDPVHRAKEAHSLAGRLQDFATGAQALRNDAMNETIRETVMSSSQLANELGISKGRVSQLAKSGPPPERNFLGTGKLTVALGGKVEDGTGKKNPGPVIAQEDFQTYDRLRSLADDLGLATSYEMVPPPGTVKLNRPNLIVICGPRLSPLIEQILESDPHLRFQHDADGWYLVDQNTGQTYRSPMDDGGTEDIAYVGRLPRPDGKGTFLYVAGIHAMGSGGVVHWLGEEIASAYKEVKTKRFSALIKSTFDPSTLDITTSERITPLYRPEGA